MEQIHKQITLQVSNDDRTTCKTCYQPVKRGSLLAVLEAYQNFNDINQKRLIEKYGVCSNHFKQLQKDSGKQVPVYANEEADKIINPKINKALRPIDIIIQPGLEDEMTMETAMAMQSFHDQVLKDCADFIHCDFRLRKKAFKTIRFVLINPNGRYGYPSFVSKFKQMFPDITLGIEVTIPSFLIAEEYFDRWNMNQEDFNEFLSFYRMNSIKNLPKVFYDLPDSDTNKPKKIIYQIKD